MNRKLIWIPIIISFIVFATLCKTDFSVDAMDNTQNSVRKEDKCPCPRGQDPLLRESINDLKEKIMIADNHLDDRVIEIIKIMYIDQMKKEMEDDTLLNILFDYNRDNYCFLVFFQKKGIGKIPLTREFYRQVEDKYKDAIKEHSMDSFMKVDMEWAGKILFKNHNKFN